MTISNQRTKRLIEAALKDLRLSPAVFKSSRLYVPGFEVRQMNGDTFQVSYYAGSVSNWRETKDLLDKRCRPAVEAAVGSEWVVLFAGDHRNKTACLTLSRK